MYSFPFARGQKMTFKMSILKSQNWFLLSGHKCSSFSFYLWSLACLFILLLRLFVSTVSSVAFNLSELFLKYPLSYFYSRFWFNSFWLWLVIALLVSHTQSLSSLSTSLLYLLFLSLPISPSLSFLYHTPITLYELTISSKLDRFSTIFL